MLKSLICTALLVPIVLQAEVADRLVETYRKQCERIDADAAKKKQMLACSLVTKLKALMHSETRKGNLDGALKIKKTIAELEENASSPKSTFSQAKVFAAVEVKNSVKTNLKVNAKIFGDSDIYKWVSFPIPLRGVFFQPNKKHQGVTEFQIKKAGKVIIAVTDRWGGGGSIGDWAKHIITKSELQSAGWKFIGNIFGTYGGPNERWEVFIRDCKAGETFRYRTEKYVAPIVIIQSAE